MGSLGMMEMVIIFLIVLLVFGAKRIPEIARGLGKGIREFKDATSEITSEITRDDSKQRINQPRQGTPTPRQSEPAHSPAAHDEGEPAPPAPARADNPAEPESSRQ